MDDVIDLKVLFARVFYRWKIFLLVLIAAYSAVVTAAIFYANLTNKVMTADISLFGIREAYPNGVAFSKTDFLEPEILQELFERVHLPDIDPEDYTSVISISDSLNDTSFIRQRYEARALAIDTKSNESSVQLRNLAAEMNQELQEANEGRYTLAVNHEEFGIPIESAQTLLAEWPKIWEQRVIDAYRVVTDLSLRTMVLVPNADLSVPENAYYANQQLEFIEGNLQKFSNDARFKKLQSEQGRTPKEILHSLAEYKTVFFTPLYSSVLSIDSPLSEFYLSAKSHRIEELNKQIASLQSIIDDVVQMEVGMKGGAARSANTSNDGDIIQIGDGTLNDIVGLVQKASLQDFLTGTLDRKHNLVVERASIERELAQVTGNKLLTHEFITNVSKIHSRILIEYNTLLSKAETLAIDEHLELFEFWSEPSVMGSRTHPKMPIWFAIPIIPMILLGMGCLSIPLAREREGTNEQKV